MSDASPTLSIPDAAPENYLAARWDMVPPALRGELRAYFEHGVMPSRFVRSVLENDFCSAATLCPIECVDHLARIGNFLFIFAPMGSWGAPVTVNLWVSLGGFAGGAHLR